MGAGVESTMMYLDCPPPERCYGTPNYLPEEFIGWTLDRGLMVSLWAPQAKILGHPASVTWGVPMISWPLFAEQMTNATLFSLEPGVAIRSRRLQS
ncbi:hypothetical protein IGI04_002644 [Brassica rapa subsp. trilocularis]|uniref:UDP-glycosyltransferases domain-containing protein n=1 Tax=Brassica rapa subsp. trilocularis TaxID=1813537 RepID=A0ABQ7NW44_BRACM|nr:hypothetical protein IGI04_002644 [Brassica rapa subsp. trilocularis]